MLEENVGIISPRQFKEESGAFITNHIIGHKTVSAYDINYIFPLYIYKGDETKTRHRGAYTMMLFEPKVKYDSKGRIPNIDAKIYKNITSKYRRHIRPESILYYIYGVLYSPMYREKYAEFLKIDFPRIPFTENYDLFRKMSVQGERLAQLHLLKSPALDSPIAKYQGSGENDTVDKVRYEAREQRVYINPDKYFDGVAPEVWNYQIGGYQVCHKWLKDRKGRLLSLEDQQTYCKIVTALEKTIEIQREIDRIFQKIEENDIITLSSDSQTGRL